ncbi:hypothetical protein ACS8E2_12835 [Psychrobacter glaciei]|uniref:hypothetical protein n=1 Tax=Psychrobacter glaciei TaxID=619771 RepID=UPI003F4903F4
MDIKKIVIIAAILLLALIGFNYYNSAQSEKARAVHVAETEALRAKNAQAEAQKAAIKKPEPVADVGIELEQIDDKPNKVDIETAKSTTCDSVSEFSESVMKARLRGIPIQDALGAIDESDMSAVYKSTFKGVIIQAYKQPDYRTDEVKERAIREFALKQYLACTDAFS